MVDNFQAAVRQRAKAQFGWELDKTSDLARIVRVAGTLNHKSSPPKPVSLWEGYAADAGVVLSRIDFERLAAETSPKPGKKTSRATASAGPPRHSPPDASARPADFESIHQGCDFIEHWVENAKDLSEPEWKAGIDIVVHCEDGERIVHEVSKADPRYSPEETQGKIERSRQVKPRTCADIAGSVGHEGCATCPYRFTVRSPIALGYVDPDLGACLSNRLDGWSEH